MTQKPNTMKSKTCSCGFTGVMWSRKKKLPDGTIQEAKCAKCARKDATPVSDYRMLNKPVQDVKIHKPINKVSDKEKKRQVAYNALRKEFMKQFPMCQFKGCNKPSEECHHVRGRIGEMLLDTTEWMAVCSNHHLYIHTNDKECRELGYLKSRIGK